MEKVCLAIRSDATKSKSRRESRNPGSSLEITALTSPTAAATDVDKDVDADFTGYMARRIFAGDYTLVYRGKKYVWKVH